MALVLADRVKENASTTGTGTFHLAGAVADFQAFVAGIGSTNTTYYSATDGTGWEVGLGTVTSGSPNTLSRSTVLSSSNSGALVNFTSAPQIACVFPASKWVYIDASGAVDINGAIVISGAMTYGGVTLTAAVTGTGDMVLQTNPVLITPNLGTPSAGTLTNCTGLPISGIASLGAGVATLLAAAATGTGGLVGKTSPVLITPNLGTPSAGTLTNCTGLPISGIASLGTGVGTILAAASTGTGAMVAANAPALTNPTATTQTTGDNSTKVATTAFVAATFSANPQSWITSSGSCASATTAGTANALNGSNSYTAVNFTATSDERLKNRFDDVSALEKLPENFSAFGYTFNSRSHDIGIKDYHEHIGVSAQELQKVDKRLVSVMENGYLGVNVNDAIAFLIQCVVELKAENAAMRKERMN